MYEYAKILVLECDILWLSVTFLVLVYAYDVYS